MKGYSDSSFIAMETSSEGFYFSWFFSQPQIGQKFCVCACVRMCVFVMAMSVETGTVDTTAGIKHRHVKANYEKILRSPT